MALYNVKILEYQDSIQIRIFDKPIKYDFEKPSFNDSDSDSDRKSVV